MKPILFLLPLVLAAAPLRAAVDDAPFQELKSYDGQARKSVETISGWLRGADAATLAEIEGKLLTLCDDPAATFPAKQEAARLLRDFGSAKSVPVLAKWLTDEKLGDLARFALERIADPAAGKALRAALVGTAGRAKMGLVSSLGNRAEAEAVADLKSLTAGDGDLSKAAVASLGKIGTKEALSALQALPNKTLPVLQAQLTAADKLVLQKSTAPLAMTAYRTVLGVTTNPVAARLSAARGLLANDSAGAPDLMVSLLTGEDSDLQALVARFARDTGIGGKQVIGAFLKLPVSSQVLMIGAYADRGERFMLPALMRLAQETKGETRLAALRGFGTIEGDGQAAMFLNEIALNTKDNAERDAARASLITMRGKVVDDAIIAAIPQMEGTEKTELIAVLGTRVVTSAKPRLLTWALADAEPVQNASLRALNDLAQPADYAALVKVMAETKFGSTRGACEGIIGRLAKQIPSETDRVAPLLAALPAATPDAKLSMLKTLGPVGGKAALDALRGEIKNPDAKVRDAAIRALTNAPGAEAMPDLLELALKAEEKTHRVLALRGYLRLAEGAVSGNNPNLALYQQAIPAATEPDLKKGIIGGVGRFNSPAALAIITPFLDDESVRGDAAGAVLNIAKNIAKANPTEVKAALQKFNGVVKDENQLKQASELLKTLPA